MEPSAHLGVSPDSINPALAADATDPDLIPAGFNAAIAYRDGKYAWTPEQEARFEWIAHYTVTGQPAAAANARIQDVELFDATPADFPLFARMRTQLGHSCGIAYSSLSVVPAILTALNSAGLLSSPDWGLLPAWWWGKPRPPTYAEVMAELSEVFGVAIDGARIRGCQWQNNTGYDSIVTYDPHLLHRPQSWPS